MPAILPDLVREGAERTPGAPALYHRDRTLGYAELDAAIDRTAHGLRALALQPDERVAVYLPKRPEAVIALFAAQRASGVAVPINPVLKAHQVGHILRDCGVRALVTAPGRLTALTPALATCPALGHVILVDETGDGPPAHDTCKHWSWSAVQEASGGDDLPERLESDLAALLYTSGSTGRPKGVMLSHRNLLVGAASVAGYLANRPDDRLLATLPLSFDYGLSQLTTAFHAGASVALFDYLLPGDLFTALDRYGITGVAGVPPLWNQLAALPWPEAAVRHLRYITNSGGALPRPTLARLQEALPATDIYLMYGLTEAFRSTYLPPSELGRRPDSIGRAIPNAEVSVVRPDGSECAVDEPGELVHRGPLVTLGYWNDPERTAERFRAAPGRPSGLLHTERAVWSGDQVRRDAEGYLYFVGRADEMIKSSGYRVSPTEIEEVAYTAETVTQAVAFGVPDPMLGEAIVLVVEADREQLSPATLLTHCRRHLPPFMMPQAVDVTTELPCGANGKIDRKAVAARYRTSVSATEVEA